MYIPLFSSARRWYLSRDFYVQSISRRKTPFFTIRANLALGGRGKIARATQADLQASTAPTGPVCENVSRQLIYSRKSAVSEIGFKNRAIRRLAPIAYSRTTRNRSCATNDLICPRDSILPLFFGCMTEGSGRDAYVFAASPAIINGDRCAGPTNSEPIVHCDDGAGGRGAGSSGFNIRVCQAYTGH